MANVNTHLACIAHVCDGDNAVLFGEHGVVLPESELDIKVKNKGNAAHFGGRGNTYSMDAWVRRQMKQDQNTMQVYAVVSGFTRPGAFEMKMCRISVEPIPSRISTPKRFSHLS